MLNNIDSSYFSKNIIIILKNSAKDFITRNSRD